MRMKVVVLVVIIGLAFGLGWYVSAQVSHQLPDFVDGQVLTAAQLNAIVDELRTLKSKQVVVVDSNGQVVGDVIGGEEHFTVVAFNVNGVVVPLAVELEEISGIEGILHFESTDCSGRAFIWNFVDLFQSAAVGPPGRTLYFADPNGVRQTISVNSSVFDGTCQTFESPASFSGVLPALTSVDLDTLFTPPFSLRFKE